MPMAALLVSSYRSPSRPVLRCLAQLVPQRLKQSDAGDAPAPLAQVKAFVSDRAHYHTPSHSRPFGAMDVEETPPSTPRTRVDSTSPASDAVPVTAAVSGLAEHFAIIHRQLAIITARLTTLETRVNRLDAILERRTRAGRRGG